MTLPLKIAAGIGVAGLIGGVVAERMLSPDTIDKNRQGDRWSAIHNDFLREHPIPAGTSLYQTSTPPWKNAAVVGGAAAGVAALGGTAMFFANKMKLAGGQPTGLAMALGVAGLLAAAGGVGVLAGTGASYAVR